MNFNSIYLPPEGKYKPASVKGATTCGYPWQYNPLVHKATSDPCSCKSRNVFRRYADNRVVYTRTRQQLAAGLYTYYLYNQQNSIIETGEVALPIHITDDNWYQHKYKSNAAQTAFIRQFSGRTNVMVATYLPTRATAGGAPLCYYPIESISCYDVIDADTPLYASGAYSTQTSFTRYSFCTHTVEHTDVSITLCHPAVAQQHTAPKNEYVQELTIPIPQEAIPTDAIEICPTNVYKGAVHQQSTTRSVPAPPLLIIPYIISYKRHRAGAGTAFAYTASAPYHSMAGSSPPGYHHPPSCAYTHAYPRPPTAGRTIDSSQSIYRHIVLR